MKKTAFAVLAFVFAVMLAIPPVFADVTISVAGTQIGRYEGLNFPAGTTTSRTAGNTDLNISPTASAVAAFTSGTIAGTAIDSSAIGGNTPAAGAFTTLSASSTAAITGVTTATGAIMANGGIDRTTAATLAIGGANANLVTITPATNVTGLLSANGGLDRSTAAALAIGPTNATSVVVTPPLISVAATNRLGNNRFAVGALVTASGSTQTVSAAAVLRNAIFQETGTTASTYTMDTGSNYSAAVTSGLTVNDCISFVITNASTQTITLAAASGTTLSYAMTVPTLTTRTVYLVNTGANTWTAY